ncbi:uncharacterized protein METZ01_LOCUS230294, partial [marine metagenome]
MLNWEEYDDKNTKLVKKEVQEKKQRPIEEEPTKKEEKQPKVALHTGSISDRLERAKKAIEQFDHQTGGEVLEGMGSRVDVDQKAMINCRADVNQLVPFK